MNLTALQHSAFLQSLGWAIANSLWQAAVLWMIFSLVNGLYKNGSAKFKNSLSTILLLSAFVWFCITLFLKYFALENFPGKTNTRLIIIDTIQSNRSAGYSWNIFLNKLSQALPYLSVAYLLLLIFLAAKLVNSYRFTSYLKTSGLQKPDVEWKLFTQKVAWHLGITKKINLWISEHIDVPATIGFLKPVILIPLASINQLSANQLEAIILHELSHIKRNDYLLNLFISIIETILFFNPFILLLGKIIKKERENCCDDFVIQYQYDRHSYASALLSLEQYRKTNLRFALSATSGKKQLLNRIKRIMEVSKGNVNFNYGQKLLALLLITGIICSIAWLSPEKSESNTAVIKNSIINKEVNQKNKFVKINSDTKQNSNITQRVIASSFSKNISPNKNEIKKTAAEKSSDGKRVKGIITPSQKNNFNHNFQSSGLFPASAISKFAEAAFNEKAFAPASQNMSKIQPRIQAEKLLSAAKNDKYHFEYYFNMNKFQSDLREQQENIEKQTTTQNFNYNLKGVEKLINNSLKNLDETKLNQQVQLYLRRIPQMKFHITPRVAGFDSASPKRVIALKRSNNFIPPEAPAVRELPKIRTNIKNNLPPAFSFQMNLNDDHPGGSSKTNKGVNRSPNNNLSIQYNNGVLIINGERINLPNTRNTIAKLKAQKLIPSNNQNGPEFGTDD